MITKNIDLKLDAKIIELANIFFKHNATLYVVGGFVRDSLLFEPAIDIDICSALTTEQVKQILLNTDFAVKTKNKQFGTATISTQNLSFEYTCFRKETYDLTGSHSPTKVEFISSLTLDATRRDFYVNALYYDILNNQVLDPLEKGLSQLNNKELCVIKHTPHKFCEDATRIIRMFKFAVQHNFRIDTQSLNSAKKYAKLLNNITKTRLEKELNFLSNCNLEQQQKFSDYLNMCEIKI